MDNYDLFKHFFDSRGMNNRRRWEGLFDTHDMFKEFEDMQKEMSRMFNAFNDISSNAPKEMVREYQTSKGDKVREVGPIVYGYSMTVGPDGRPHVREFGNVKSLGNSSRRFSMDIDDASKPTQIITEREPLADVNSIDNEVKVILEMPGIKKEDIKINAFDGEVEVIADNPQRKYHKNIEIPKDADIETARSIYNNGILEVTFDKKKNIKPKGKQIKIG